MEQADVGILRNDLCPTDGLRPSAVDDGRLRAIKLIRGANVTIHNQWEGATGYISEAEATRLVDAINGAARFDADEAYALFLVLDTLARSLNGNDPIVNHFRERLLPVYRGWHNANPGEVHPSLIVP